MPVVVVVVVAVVVVVITVVIVVHGSSTCTWFLAARICSDIMYIANVWLALQKLVYVFTQCVLFVFSTGRQGVFDAGTLWPA